MSIRPAIDLRHGRWQDVLDDVVEVDAVIMDPPYSARTHAGDTADAYDGATRSRLSYEPLSLVDLREVVESWHPRCRGWFVVMTSHDLIPAWEDALRDVGRYVFAPVPFVAPGSRLRMAGDGPSCWTTHVIVARPRREPFSRWGTLPGAYVMPKGHSDKQAITGGKPLWVMRCLVEDYTRKGDLVCDPFAGAATTLVASVSLHRHAVGAEACDRTFAIAQDRIEAGVDMRLIW